MSTPELMLVTESSGSGMGRFTVELANAIQRAGVAVQVVAPPQQHEFQGVAHAVLAPPTSRHRIAKLANLARLSAQLAGAILRRGGRDRPVLMVHLAPSLPASLLPIAAARLRGASIALNLHDFYPHTLRFPVRLRGVERALYRWAYRRFDLVLTTTDEQARRLATNGVRTDRIASLYHGVFTVPGIAAPDAASPTRLLVFGSLRPNKRVLESIWAVRRLRDEGVNVELRIAGAPRREDADYWRDCLAALPSDGIGFDVQARFIDEAELSAIYSGVDAFLCPYADFDSQSGVSMTAVSNGVPVIGTSAARAASLPASGEGWTTVADAADVTAIADAITAFLKFPRDQRRADADVARARIEEVAGWPRLGRLYAEAMTDRGFWARPGPPG
ncbi:glycosyltransferase family 4 protein [Sphingomonas yunnanensis]|uniref:glycosyltransferase family 4 protein n=1 Tax=Sphingomonas yunnanensis TaxID=310400 RepID=UPI001CA740DE|nr:glycosyltransferase family 4 protein [Sphingomonas yunnanensis]MBY9062818.1 glycosyltransferase family 4 protein [Sphingomonas yunnanensis]